jgi:hypothetical protein
MNEFHQLKNTVLVLVFTAMLVVGQVYTESRARKVDFGRAQLALQAP